MNNKLYHVIGSEDKVYLLIRNSFLDDCGFVFSVHNDKEICIFGEPLYSDWGFTLKNLESKHTLEAFLNASEVNGSHYRFNSIQEDDFYDSDNIKHEIDISLLLLDALEPMISAQAKILKNPQNNTTASETTFKFLR